MYSAWGFVVIIAYLILMLLTRWIFVARRELTLALAQSEMIVRQLATIKDPKLVEENSTVARTVDELLDDASRQRPVGRISGMIAWSGTDVLATSALVHAAERQCVWLMPDRLVIARLLQLSRADRLPTRLQAAFQAADLERQSTDGGIPFTPEQVTGLRLLLSEVLVEEHTSREATAAQLYEFYNKVFWLIIISLIPVAALVGLGYSLVLISGAIGGIISRMQRLVFAPRIPTSFGSSWMPLYVAPVLGALAAWAGLGLLRLLQTLGIVELSAILPDDSAMYKPTMAVFALAFLFGLSERFLNRVGDQAEAALNLGWNATARTEETGLAALESWPGRTTSRAASDLRKQSGK